MSSDPPNGDEVKKFDPPKGDEMKKFDPRNGDEVKKFDPPTSDRRGLDHLSFLNQRRTYINELLITYFPYFFKRAALGLISFHSVINYNDLFVVKPGFRAS